MTELPVCPGDILGMLLLFPKVSHAPRSAAGYPQRSDRLVLIYELPYRLCGITAGSKEPVLKDAQPFLFDVDCCLMVASHDISTIRAYICPVGQF